MASGRLWELGAGRGSNADAHTLDIAAVVLDENVTDDGRHAEHPWPIVDTILHHRRSSLLFQH
jgi:hypothetical protein